MCDTFSTTSGALYLDMNEKLPDVSSYEKELDKLKTKYKQGKISDVMFETMRTELTEKIETGHKYTFIGRVGHFCPIKSGAGGGIMYRIDGEKKSAASGTIGYRWLESEMIRGANEDNIDTSYFTDLVDAAVDTINKYVDFEWFASDDPYVAKPKIPDFMNIPEGLPEKIPFDEDPVELPFN